MTKILMVLTSHNQLGTTGKTTGWYVSEAAHPWKEFTDAGFEIDWVSPLGGTPSYDGYDPSDPVQQAFLHTYAPAGPHTMTPGEIDPTNYDAIMYVGGHGTMWDFPDNVGLSEAAAAIYEQGGAVAAVCHGPAGLVNITLSTGEPLVAGKRVAAFTDEEEAAVGLSEVVPFLLAKTLVDRGAIHMSAPNFQANVVVDGRLVTGQNPASAIGVGQQLVAVLTALRTAA
jgi:putative intracellular protease/amidase